jgi:thiol-disulfide isomerase/thioredoxin
MRKPVRRTPAWLPAAATVGGIALLVTVFVAIRWFNTPAPPPPPDPNQTAQVLAIITNLPPSELEQVGAGSSVNRIKAIKGAALTGPGGKPMVFYYGAEFCPYCAAERWAMIVALSRFGSFTGLKTTSSSSTDIFPNLATFTFHGATYSSQYVEFQALEVSDRNQNPLETPTAAQTALVNSYDTGGTIPFVDLGNRYAFNGATYTPDAMGSLDGLTWQQIATDLQDPGSPQAQSVLGSANLITAAICKLTADQPASVCSGSAIQSIEGHL